MKCVVHSGVLCLAGLLGASLSWAATPDDCHALRKHGRRPEAQKCYESLSAARDPYLRAEGYWGMEMYQEANNQFRIAVAQSPANAMVRVRWGRLMHERFNNTDAANLFKEALEKDPKNAQAYYGLALVSADGFDSKALEYAGTALQLDPKIAAAHFSLGILALGHRDMEAAEKEFQAELTGHPEDAQAQYHLAFVWLKRQNREPALKLLIVLLRDGLEQRERHLVPDDRGRLEKPLVLGREPVDLKGAGGCHR